MAVESQLTKSIKESFKADREKEIQEKKEKEVKITVDSLPNTTYTTILKDKVYYLVEIKYDDKTAIINNLTPCKIQMFYGAMSELEDKLKQNKLIP